MSFCGFCGTKLPTDAKFCGECGRGTNEPFTAPASVPSPLPGAATTVLPAIVPATPEPPPSYAAPASADAAPESTPASMPVPATRKSSGGLLAIVALLGLVAAGVGAFLLTRSDDDSAATAASTTAVDATSAVDTTTITITTPPTDPVQAASDQLQALITQDRPTVDTLVGNWVVQLSAKRVGLKADGIEYGPIEISADHTTLRNAYGAVLVDAGAFQFQSDGAPMIGWFLTMAPEIFTSKEDAAKWCVDRSLTANVCLARRFPQPRT